MNETKTIRDYKKIFKDAAALCFGKDTVGLTLGMGNNKLVVHIRGLTELDARDSKKQTQLTATFSLTQSDKLQVSFAGTQFNDEDFQRIRTHLTQRGFAEHSIHTNQVFDAAFDDKTIKLIIESWHAGVKDHLPTPGTEL